VTLLLLLLLLLLLPSRFYMSRDEFYPHFY